MRRAWAALWLAVLILPACQEPPDPPLPAATTVAIEELTPAERALLVQAEPYTNIPREEDLPVPPDGWYTLELDGDKIDVFRDEYGVPHVFAPSVEAAFRAQGYVITEDRCIQLLEARLSVIGWRAVREGSKGVGNDTNIRQRGYTPEECQAFIDAIQPEHRRLMQEYLKGANIYLARYAPATPPENALELAAGMARFMTSAGDVFGGQQLNLFKVLSLVEFLRGDEFMRKMLDDCMPLDVPNSPTTDHSCDGQRRREDTQSISRPLHFKPDEVATVYRDTYDFVKQLENTGQFTKWGSQTWAVSGERSASGNAMVFSGPMIGFQTPPQGAVVHLVAPGMNISGLCFVGAPGVVMGHNENIAWGITSGMVVETDIFVEELNPDNELQYRYKGEWKDMEVVDAPMAVRQPDGSLQIERYQAHRTVHGPVVHWVRYNNRAYVRSSTFRGHEAESFTALLDMNFATNIADVEQAARRVWTSQNFIAADASGNIGYFLAGRIPVRHPEQDPRLPTPGTGEYDWQGLLVATDVVKCVNPEEGWLGNFNNKPSIKTPGWWPEMMWGHRIHQILRDNNPIDWDTFVGINKANGEHFFAGPFMKPYLVDLIRKRGKNDPRSMKVAQMLDDWPDNDVAGQPCVLIFNEWMLDTMVEMTTPDFKGVVSRDTSIDNLQLFGLLTFRLLCPEKAGYKLKGDYLHGRDKDEIAYRCFVNVLDRLTAAHGPDMTKWPHTPDTMKMGELDPFPTRNCGVFWMATELGRPVHAMDMLVPGQSGHHKSPHFKDQRPLFDAWKLKQTRFYPEEFERPAR